MSLDSELEAAVGGHNRALSEVQLANHEFSIAARMYDWPRAEAARLRVISHCEAQLDAFVLACRLTQQMADQGHD